MLVKKTPPGDTGEAETRSCDAERACDLGQAIHKRFIRLGGVELPDTLRERIREPVDLHE
jgi:hypothetical protein